MHNDELIKKYPKLYREVSYIECGDGWFNLLNELSNKIEQHIIKNNIKDMFAMQVKEKFGGLRFYMTCFDDKVEQWINEAEDKAANTCELCGNAGKIHWTNGWASCLCSKHLKEKNEK